jgi:prepilin-type N-terminal cleavage/methylation domain-containing protein
MKRGFTLIETLVVIAIIAIILLIAVFWFPSWIKTKKVETDTNKIYLLIKKYQLLAMRQKITVNVTLSNATTIEVKYDSKTAKYSLDTPFNATDNLTIDEFGRFHPASYPNLIQRVAFHSTENTTGKNCVKTYIINACEGHWNGTSCVCEY